MEQRIFNIFIAALISIITIMTISIKNKCDKAIEETLLLEEEPSLQITTNYPDFFLRTFPNEESLIEALQYYNIKHPEIVFAQAILETGHFKSRVCIEYNNLFGLYNSTTKDYYKFNHWTESIAAYIDYIQYKYSSNTYNDYYTFLKNIGYAEDPNYINKLKEIVFQYDKRRITDTTNLSN